MRKILFGVGAILLLTVISIFAVQSNKKAVTTDKQLTKLYIALGDSVAAGVGLKDDSDSSACDRTNQSYPNQVADTLHYKLYNFACSGATLSNGILGTQNVNDLLVTPQAQQLFASQKPSLISLTIGANDANWTSILEKCYTSECGTDSDTAAVTASLAMVSTNIKTFLSQVQTKYAPNPPHVIVTGYHQVFPATDVTSCADLTGIDASELVWGRQLQTNITSIIQQAVATYSFVTFVPVNFSGHELCTADPWVQGLLDKEPYHPTQAGQAAFANAIEKAVRSYK